MQHTLTPHLPLVAGMLFVHQGRKYRLNSFLCEVVEKPVENELLAELFAEWDAEVAASLPVGMRHIKLRYCLLKRRPLCQEAALVDAWRQSKKFNLMAWSNGASSS